MKPLRLVLVLLEPPLPFGNAAARWYYVLLRGLVERGHRVTAFAACSKPAEIPVARDLFPQPRYDLRCFPISARRGWRQKWATLRQPYSYMFSAEFRAELERTLAQGFDILHLEQLLSAWLGLRHPWSALVSVHYLAGIDLANHRPDTLRNRWARYTRLAVERRLLRAMHFFRAGSSRLVPDILGSNPRAHVTVVPLGIDPSLYRYIPDEERPRSPVISVIGSMDWNPTYSAARRLITRLWPALKQHIPDARLQIVGWNACRMLAEFRSLPDVTIEENVPDTHPYFARTGVLLYAPERGSGMKVKIMEALAFGVPVVTTSEGVEGIPAEDGVHAGIAEDDAGLVERTVRLLRDPDVQNRQRAAGRALLECHCAPQPTLDGIESIYRQMLPQPRDGENGPEAAAAWSKPRS